MLGSRVGFVGAVPGQPGGRRLVAYDSGFGAEGEFFKGAMN